MTTRSHESDIQTMYDTDSGIRLTKRGKRVRNALVAAASLPLGVGLSVAGHNSITTDYEGSKIVKLSDGDTVSDIANTEVEHGASHTGDVVEEIVRRNPEVFQDGKAYVGTEDIGKTIDVPEEVE